MAVAAEPAVIKDTIATSTTNTTTTTMATESDGLEALLESESMSVSSSDLSSSEVDAQVDSVENVNEAEEASPKEAEESEQEVGLGVEEEEGQSDPVESTGATLDEVEVAAVVSNATTVTVTTVNAKENEEEEENTEQDEEGTLTSKVPMEEGPEEEEQVDQDDDQVVAMEVASEAVECSEVMVAEDESNSNENTNISCGAGDGDIVDVDIDLEEDGKENKENEDEDSEGQIILTGTTSIDSSTESSTGTLTNPTEVVDVDKGECSLVSVDKSTTEIDDDILEIEEIGMTLSTSSRAHSRSVDVSKGDSDGSQKSEELIPEKKTSDLIDPNIVQVPSSSSSSSTASVSQIEPKIEDIENNINKIIHMTQSSQMQVSSSPQEVKSQLCDQIRAMKRSDLETLIVDKIIEAIAIHSNVGVLNQKLHQANAQKDRLFHKISNLQRQVTELSKAVRSVSENVGRNQKTVNKTNQPIRFYRSVGVQVFLEGPINPPSQSRAMIQDFSKPTMEPRKSVLKSGSNNSPSTLPQQLQTSLKPVPGQVPLSTLLNGNVNPGLKRAKPTVSVAEVAKLVENQNKIRRVSPAGTPVSASPAKNNVNSAVNGMNSKSPSRLNLPVQQQQQQLLIPQQQMMRNPAAAVASKVLSLNPSSGTAKSQNGNNSHEPGIVDLTDDDAVVAVATTSQNSNTPPKKTVIPTTAATSASALIVNGKNNNSSNVVLSQNGVQYRLISPGPQYQFIQNGQSYQIVTSANQTRPVFVPSSSLPKMGTQIRPGVTPQNISLLRGLVPGSQVNGAPININAGGQIIMRPMVASGAKPLANAVTPMMTKQQQQFPQQAQGHGQPVNISMVAARQQAGNQVVASRNGANNVVGLRIPNQSVRPMGQVPRGNPRANVDAIKKFILPPLPPPAIVGNPRRCSKDIPPRPDLNLTEQEQGIVLSWTLKLGPNHAEIQTYQIYACQEPLFNNPKSGSWKRVGDVKALPLPMACTLSQFTDENRYHFIVRGVDVYNRTGPFCEAAAITLKKK